MEIHVLCIIEEDIDSAVIEEGVSMLKFDEQTDDTFYVHKTNNIPDSEEFLFSCPVSVLMFDGRIEGLGEYIAAMKQDEMFKYLPVVILYTEGSHKDYRVYFHYGADVVIMWPVSAEELHLQIKPLIKNKLQLDELHVRIHELNEQNVKDGILLDIIKRYIPHSVWNSADYNAENRTLKIPEEELIRTILYGDIRDFTYISQYMKPKQVIQMLNETLSVVTNIIYSNNGDIDKFIGDAFLAIFSDPLDAVTAACDIQNELLKINKNRADNDLPLILFRIGAHTGPVIRGNIGGEERKDNTLIGDTVNTAARIESISPAGEVLCSQNTIESAKLDVPEKYKVVEQVKGKEQPVTTYNIYKYYKETLSGKKEK